MNSATSKSANGTEVYYSVSNNKTSFSGITSKAMANLFRKQLLADLKTTNRGTKTAAYYVLKHNTVPAILIELGFISGNSDYSKLTNATFQKMRQTLFIRVFRQCSKPILPAGRIGDRELRLPQTNCRSCLSFSVFFQRCIMLPGCIYIIMT